LYLSIENTNKPYYNKKASTSKKGAVPAIHKLFASSFFSSALLIQWSNLVGPKVEKVWSVEPLDEKTQMMIGRQVLNGEMGRTLTSVEPKWIVLHAMICTAFLYQDHALNSLCALVFVLPVRYLRNFSPYFNVLCERVPNQLIDPLVKLRKLHKPHSLVTYITIVVSILSFFF
jgi:hypothetical protein